MASGVDTHTHTHTYFGGTKVISRKQAHAGLQLACVWFNNPIILDSYSSDQGHRNVSKSGGAIIIYMIESYCAKHNQLA